MSAQPQKSVKRLNTWFIVAGIVAIVLLAAIPLALIQNSQFGGSDGLGATTIETIAPDYDPTWTTNWWSPPGSETESALFAVQAAVGGVLIGYFFGYMRGKKQISKDATTRRTE